MPKLLALGFIFLGITMIIFFPYTGAHQMSWFTNIGILMGILLLGIGIFLWKL
ncbi:MAG: hypothetical protein J4428_05330 [Candidatus Aenigmarchaeota archaeon]|nr:hypothetical protein [Candidatus Aenigmarchaeota archaeon]